MQKYSVDRQLSINPLEACKYDLYLCHRGCDLVFLNCYTVTYITVALQTYYCILLIGRPNN